VENGFNDTIEVFIHFIIPKMQHFEAYRGKPRVPLDITMLVAGFAMPSAIDLDNKLRFQTGKSTMKPSRGACRRK